ncbi:MAG: hypothetical protein FWE08_06365 [Oscillospiraceae bacterium]|nr:hypothetical protein [Oscillospiraceae bacterium]
MKKKLFALLLVFVMMATLFAGCGDLFGDRRPAETPDAGDVTQAAGEAKRGSWDGDVFISEYLGLQFTLPSGWAAASDEEMAEIMGMGIDVIDGMDLFGLDMDIGGLMDVFGVMNVTDMMASSLFTGASIDISFERLIFPHNRMSEEEYIESMAASMEMLGMDDLSMEIINFPGTTKIGAYAWYSYGMVMEFMGVEIFSRYFITIQDGFSRTITITYVEGSETVEEILEMFSAL